MTKRKNIQTRILLFLLPPLLLLIIGIAEVLFFSSVRFEEPPLEPGQTFRFQVRDVQRIELYLYSNEGITVKKALLETPEQIGNVINSLNDFRYQKSNFINPLDPQASSETPSYQISFLSIGLVFAADEFTCWISPYENGELTHLRRRYIGDTSNLISLCHKLLENPENNKGGGNTG